LREGGVARQQASASLGEVKLTLLGAVNNLTGRGDQLGAEFGWAEGIPHDLRLRYRTPITARDTALGVHYENTEAIVKEEPFDVLDITSRLETIGIELSHPVYRTPNRQLVLAGVLERRETETTLLGVPFSFSPGVNDGKATVSVLRLVADYLDRGRTQVIAARSTISVGLDAFVLLGEQLAGAAEAGLDLIEDERNALPGAKLAHLGEVARRRYRDPGGRGADDAARRGRCVRRFGHLQVR